MIISCLIKYNHVSPKKMRHLAHAMVGLKTQVALERLSMVTDKASKLLYKAIKSAQSNGVNNSKLPLDSLKVKTIEINKGPFLKRWNPVSKGMAHAIKKRTSHIRVVVESLSPSKPVMITDGKSEINEKAQNSKLKVQIPKEKISHEIDKKLEKGKGK